MTLLAAAPAASAAPVAVLTSEQGSLFERFVRYLDTSEKTIATYSRALRQWGKWLAENGIHAPRREDVIAFRRHLEATHSAGTARNYITAVKMLYRWAGLEGLYQNIGADVRGPKSDMSQKRDALTAGQARALLQAAEAEGSSERALRDTAIVATLLCCGLRSIEIVRANIGHLRTVGGQCLLFVHGKGRSSADTFVRVPEEVEKRIRAYLACRGPLEGGVPLFASVSNRNLGGRMTTRAVSGIVHTLLAACGLASDRVSCHSTRHFFVTEALLSGQSIQDVAAAARHARISTTQIYAHNLDLARNACTNAVAGHLF